ncbi:xanthine dehydrogenase molybdopterin binding subunit [Sphingomonas oligophenolica]|uniref:Xanthine dehydrogenase molybdopterin binding subunit n=1 Tax=Sphingomonas oligophenolica TaxID=301154 RepID=A0ABU9Y5Y7_9SPHN
MADAGFKSTGAVNRPLHHDSALEHVAGTARYVDDMPEAPGLLHLAFGLAADGHAKLLSLDLEAVRAAPGVVIVLTAADIPGVNDVSPVKGDDKLFAEKEILYPGQPLFVVAATSVAAARRAARLGKAEVEPLPALVTIDQALAAESAIEDTQVMARGDAAAALAAAPHRLTGGLEMGGQEHFYLEGQAAFATPGEGGQLHVLSSTQHPSEVQHLIAKVLKLSHADVTVEVRRMGGAFGGKETQAAAYAVACALVAAKTGRPARIRADRDDDMAMTGKRHDFAVRYDVGFDDAGRIAGVRIELASRCGATADLSSAINDRAMFHADNCYWLPAVEIVSHRLKTHTVSNTAFRGFGGPQGMMAIERVMDAIAAARGLDPLAVRWANLYAPGRDITPYHMRVEDNVAPELIEELAERTDYDVRRAAVAAFNASHRVLKKGLALTPVKFGISFTTTHLNQAGALVLLHADGSIQLNHGGTEMGQGLMIKVAQIVADVFAVPVERVRVTSTRTDKVPNTSATAASSGADLNGMAAYNAAQQIRARLADFAADRFGGAPEAVRFTGDGVVANGEIVPFEALCRMAHIGRISLSSTGFYATPKIEYDRAAHRGRPFLYFAYGAALSEVVIDTLTGEHRVLAVDILHDVGHSLNPAIDLGQVEGGFIQGMGWLTTEELVYDDRGRLLTHAPSTYKIPTASDRPRRMDIRLWERGRNAEATIHRSKAVGEPPFMLAISVFSALTHAVAAAAPGKGLPSFDAPATPERILAAIEELKARDG